MIILARAHVEFHVPATHKRKPRNAASVTGEAVGEKEPKTRSTMCKVVRLVLVYDR